MQVCLGKGDSIAHFSKFGVFDQWRICLMDLLNLQTEKDCSYFKWADPLISKFLLELLLDLKNAVVKLKKEKVEAEAVAVAVEGRNDHVEEVQKMNHSLQKQLLQKDTELESKVEELLKKDEELKGKEKELQALQAKVKTGCTSFYGFVCVFVLGMLVGILISVSKME